MEDFRKKCTHRKNLTEISLELREYKIKKWWAHQDSNLGPRDYESPAPVINYNEFDKKYEN